MTGLWTAQTLMGKEVKGYYVKNVQGRHFIIKPSINTHSRTDYEVDPDTLINLDMAEKTYGWCRRCGALVVGDINHPCDKCGNHDLEHFVVDVELVKLQSKLTLYDEMKAENQKLNLLLFHTENGLSHPDLQGDIDKSKMCGLCDEMVTALEGMIEPLLRYESSLHGCAKESAHKGKRDNQAFWEERTKAISDLSKTTKALLDKAKKLNEKETNL